jgi:cytochrome oxidase Cu insertion factor (SCO1/SenC/PrrC family)
MRKAFLRAIALVALLLVVAGAVLIYTPWGRSLWQLSADELTGTALIGGPFQLKDQNGTVRRDADFRGQYLLVFFGYSNCPDTCPIVLRHMTEALDKLGPKAEKITPVFITVDPKRDTASTLKGYAANFHPRLIALTGSVAEIDAVAKEYRVYYGKPGEEPDDGALDHSALVYLMGPDGKYVAAFAPETSADDMARELRQRL